MKAENREVGQHHNSTREDAQNVAQAAQAELLRLLEMRAEIAKRLATIKKVREGLASMFGDHILSEDLLRLLPHRRGVADLGLLESCRLLLMESCKPMSVEEMCKDLRCRMPRLVRQQKDIYNSVAIVFEQLSRNGIARPVIRDGAETSWELVLRANDDKAEPQRIEATRIAPAPSFRK